MSRRIVRELQAQIDSLETELEYVTGERDRLIADTFREEVPWTQPNAS